MVDNIVEKLTSDKDWEETFISDDEETDSDEEEPDTGEATADQPAEDTN